VKSIRHLGSSYQALAITADDLLEFHAARLLLLVRWCGVAGEIDGLTKLAKLDFFVRYPSFFAEACSALGQPRPPDSEGVESEMVRHHYGPWDRRYYHVLAFLEGTGLLEIVGEGRRRYRFRLTHDGLRTVDQLSHEESFGSLVEQMKHVRTVLGPLSGNSLKNYIYGQFDAEVAQLGLGEVIHERS